MQKLVTINIDEKEYPLDLIKETAYLFSGDFWILIERGNGTVKVTMEQINKKKQKNIRKEFFDRLKEEKIKGDVFDENLKFREYLIKQAMIYQPQSSQAESSEGLTKKEEMELEKLIKEVEEELKNETGGNSENEIKRTWEEKYGGSKK